ncbi:MULTISPECIES: hypothetical protein [unclassified Campylobacter]|uniref:hypothetical protein n=1 Tax=unclassified Campylobacter TaxID=2593542 RepID=UPI0022EA04DB|nr:MULTISPECIES: hypothetical protein [unclassified Campylobacter]MDA3079010.1 hypothetical protein [Campylobacter sp. CS_NA2]MDA3080699.1 hypothetical protein [Campylobacter sp. CS_NA1]MDA3085096.1 hypothetical protein [Campylobacter sp. CS_ED1]MDA3089873.1 hypothetical protein [Campylobacter sp. CS_ED2]WBR51570.1 hypothetical protein PF026_01645 [Campylobacter sp. CS_NA3]
MPTVKSSAFVFRIAPLRHSHRNHPSLCSGRYAGFERSFAKRRISNLNSQK